MAGTEPTLEELEAEYKRLDRLTKAAYGHWEEAAIAAASFKVGDRVLALKGYGGGEKLVEAEITNVRIKWGKPSYIVAWIKKDGTKGKVTHEIWNWSTKRGPYPLDDVAPEAAPRTPITPDML